MVVSKYGVITFANKKELSEYITKQIEPEFMKKQNEAIKQYHATVDESIENGLKQARKVESKRAVNLLLPVMTTILFETLRLSEEKTKKVIRRVAELMQECTDEKVFEWEEYKEFCMQKGKKYFDVEEMVKE